MNRNFKYLIILLTFIGFVSCGTTKKNVYSFSGSHFKSDSTTALKKFDKIKYLKIINYTYTEFPNNVINRLTKIETLVVLSDHLLEKLYKDDPMVHIGEFEIDSLFIDSIALDSMPYLKSLSLWGFTFKSFPYELSRLKNLEELDLTLCSLTDLPEDLSKFKNLKKLDLSYNDFSTIPESVILPKSLEVLVVSNNKLTDFPTRLIPSTSLKEINLTRNNFKFDKKLELLLALTKNDQIDKVYIDVNSCDEKKELNRIIENKSLTKKIKVYVYGKPICL